MIVEDTIGRRKGKSVANSRTPTGIIHMVRIGRNARRPPMTKTTAKLMRKNIFELSWNLMIAAPIVGDARTIALNWRSNLLCCRSSMVHIPWNWSSRFIKTFLIGGKGKMSQPSSYFWCWLILVNLIAYNIKLALVIFTPLTYIQYLIQLKVYSTFWGAGILLWAVLLFHSVRLHLGVVWRFEDAMLDKR